MCTRRMPVDICVKIAIPATRDHQPRGDTLAPNRQCPLVAGTTVVSTMRVIGGSGIMYTRVVFTAMHLFVMIVLL